MSGPRTAAGVDVRTHEPHRSRHTPRPPDLIDPQRALHAARQAAQDHGNKVAAERRELFPGEDQWRERAVWPEDGPERAELARLRAERDALWGQIRHHPVMEQARAEGCAKETGFALQKAGLADADGGS
ncbi:hypothetical protein [Streptacidiphilus anmyonensis]|uniref:hypothetical protein n=1 Tax=Streptacidiphilus anmyonensis TaxID=405782 RepID=UPI0005A7CF37|nr:hypothetical protein [Streptacidiphilus anmyonensis]